MVFDAPPSRFLAPVDDQRSRRRRIAPTPASMPSPTPGTAADPCGSKRVPAIGVRNPVTNRWFIGIFFFFRFVDWELRSRDVQERRGFKIINEPLYDSSLIPNSFVILPIRSIRSAT